MKNLPLVKFLLSTQPMDALRVAIMSSISGLSGGAVLATLNAAAIVEGGPKPHLLQELRLITLFLLSLAVLVAAKVHSINRSSVLVETIVKNIRQKIGLLLQKADLDLVEKLDPTTVYTTVARDTSILSQAVTLLAGCIQQVVLLAAGLCYLAWLSVPALLMFLVAALACVILCAMLIERMKESYGIDQEKQNESFRLLREMLSGFKEIKLNESKRTDLSADYTQVTEDACSAAILAGRVHAQVTIFGDAALYFVLGAVVFLLPHFHTMESELLTKIIVVVMFVFGPLGNVISTIPQLSNADVAIQNLASLERQLSGKSLPEGCESASFHGVAFRTLELREVVFSYLGNGGQSQFSVGPISLSVHSGSITFITGGNGSGKSTLVKVLTGLYSPTKGEILLDGRPIDGTNRCCLRSLFAAVFSDFHLFRRLYGTEELDPGECKSLLRLMEMHGKVEIQDGRFTTTDLSTGQRKRLALIAALLEKRPAIVLDEWAADQDPIFREKFYTEILPWLRSQGMAIIAISHDDRYWGLGDQLVKLDFGSIS